MISHYYQRSTSPGYTKIEFKVIDQFLFIRGLLILQFTILSLKTNAN